MAISPRTRLLTLGLSAILAVGVIGGATASFAQGPGRNGDDPAASGERHHRRGAIVLTLRSIAAHCDLTKEELKAGFMNGQSINDILTAKGEDPAECQATVLAAFQAKLDELVTNGRITQERADAAYAKAEEKLPVLMAKVPERPHAPAPAVAN